MKEFKHYLESSTIHGLAHIAASRSFMRIFWIFVVFFGFSTASYLIYDSFYFWKQSPVSTTIETLPISQITLPNITVCPRKNSVLNLNFDIKESERMELNDTARVNLLQHAKVITQEKFYEEIMRNLSFVENLDRFYNWYHGITRAELPYHSSFHNKLSFNVYTSARSGIISIRHFGEKYSNSKFLGNFFNNIRIFVPEMVQNDKNVTFILNINKSTIRQFSSKDELQFSWKPINPDITIFSRNITPPNPPHNLSYSDIRLSRGLSEEEINQLNEEEFVPGFRLTWNYDGQVDNLAKYKSQGTNMEFKRSL